MSNCSNDDDISNYDLTGNWRVIYFMENDTKITKEDKNSWPDINNGDITASFSELNDNGKGEVSGITVSNNYNGDYTISENGVISIGLIATTYINEPEWTDLYRLSSAENYEIKNSKLIIFYNNKKNSIVFERNLD
jgi:hypothetical protein